MKPYPKWSIILGSVVLLYFAFVYGGFFTINYVIGGAGLLMGFYNLWKH